MKTPHPIKRDYKHSRVEQVEFQEFMKSRARSFTYAFSGWDYVIRTQKNAWIHALVTIIVIAMGIWLQVSVNDWIILILTITLVWAAEIFNTAIEAAVDLASPRYHPLARISKDVSAAAVLVTALAAVLIGVLVLGPPFMARIQPLLAR
jgi:diacylglycerol kinase